MLLRDPADLPEELVGRFDYSSLSLNRFQDHGRGLWDSAVRVGEDPFEVAGWLHAAAVPTLGRLAERAAVAVRVGGEMRFGGEGRKARFRLRLRSDRQSAGGLAVVRSFEGDDGVPVPVVAGELQCGFHRIGSRWTAEEHKIG